MTVSSHNNEAFFFSLKKYRRRGNFENFYTRIDKVMNIGNLFFRAPFVVYHNSARPKALGTKSRH